jgi:hypothetical protein
MRSKFTSNSETPCTWRVISKHIILSIFCFGIPEKTACSIEPIDINWLDEEGMRPLGVLMRVAFY